MKAYSRIVFGAGLIAFLAFAAVVGPWIWGRSPTALGGLPLEKPSWEHPFGTDDLGRDELARILHGGRVSLFVAVVAISVGLAGGAIIGLVSGHFGGKLDAILMRFIDGLQAFPALLLAVMIAAALGPGLWKVMVAIGIAMVPEFARLSRSQALRIRHEDFIDAARLAGRREAAIIGKHVVPNSLSAIVVYAATASGVAILSQASLAFIGLGASPPTADWGAMLQGGRPYISINSWLTVIPGAAIALTTFAFIFLGDGLRDWLDPRTKH